MPQRKKDPSARARANKASTAATLHEVEVPDTSELTVPALKAYLRSHGLSTTGNKLDLRARIEQDIRGIPDLPVRAAGWHEQTVAWWCDVWSSPMSTEWHDSDIHNVYLCAMLYDDLWRGKDASARQKAAAEFRQQRMALGLTPYDRRRLEWTIATAEDATDRGNKRRATQTPQAPVKDAGPDPRAALHAVN